MIAGVDQLRINLVVCRVYLEWYPGSIGGPELPLDGTPQRPGASHCLVSDRLRWLQL
jgi:hypothetical protein